MHLNIAEKLQTQFSICDLNPDFCGVTEPLVDPSIFKNMTPIQCVVLELCKWTNKQIDGKRSLRQLFYYPLNHKQIQRIA